MAPLTRWGLPARTQDDLLFGGRQPWPAQRYGAAQAAEERRRRAAGADTDLNPLAHRQYIVNLTPDDDARAEILRRYRLYSRQPDEMITFMALQRMRPRAGDFDPRLYQYGGGYIYLIGAALGLTSLLGLTHLTGSVDAYLERPELFAAFYQVARLVTLAFGALLLVAAWKLACRAAGRLAGWLTFFLLALCPVFISGVLEAKPHVPSACLILWATLSALDFRTHGRWRDAVRLGCQAGYAFGLVLTGLAVAATAAVLAVLGPRHPLPTAPRAGNYRRRLWVAVALAAAVYCATNPYIPYNYLFERESLASNVTNSLAMYADQMRRAAAGLVRVGELLRESCGIGVGLVGLVGFVILLRHRARDTTVVAAPGVAMLVMGAMLGAGKPAEFARFLILPVSLLCIASAVLLTALARQRRLAALVFGCIIIGLTGPAAYLRAFATDADGKHESRRLAGLYLRNNTGPDETIGVLQEPAPYAVPPLDFTTRTILWLPPTRPPEFDATQLPAWLVFTADDDAAQHGAWWTTYYRQAARFPLPGTSLSRITWANKPTFVYRRH